MAIAGQESLTIGVENQAVGSDSLYVAFTKVQNNFNTLFSTSSPYSVFNGNTGILTTANATSGTLTITNTGVTSINAGTGIAISGSTGNVTISYTGQTGGAAGVTSVGVISGSLNITNTPIVSAGNITIELPNIASNGGAFLAGQYRAPNVTVDQYGRITAISNAASIGTVTSVAIQSADSSLSITGSPITSSGTIIITNNGVTNLNAGAGIQLSGSNGNVTISALQSSTGTVSRVQVNSSSLTVTGSPITSSGIIDIELPSAISLAGNLVAGNVVSNNIVSLTGNLVAGNITSNGFANVTGNITAGNISATKFTGYVLGNIDGVIGANTAYTGNFTSITTSANANVGGNIYLTGDLRLNSGSAANVGNVNASNVNTSNNVIAVANVSANNFVAGNIITAQGNITTSTNLIATGNVKANYLILSNSLPVSSVANGTIAIDSANSRIGVYLNGSWKYATLA